MTGYSAEEVLGKSPKWNPIPTALSSAGAGRFFNIGMPAGAAVPGYGKRGVRFANKGGDARGRYGYPFCARRNDVLFLQTISCAVENY